MSVCSSGLGRQSQKPCWLSPRRVNLMGNEIDTKNLASGVSGGRSVILDAREVRKAGRVLFERGKMDDI